MSYRQSQPQRRHAPRPASKRPPRKKATNQQTATSQQFNETQAEAADIESKTLNSLSHLGSQRFALPPYSDQFELWMRNLKFTLSEFESSLGPKIDEAYRTTVAQILTELESEFRKKAADEMKQSHLVGEMNLKITQTRELLAQVEREHRQTVRRLTKEREDARREVAALRKERSRLANFRAGFISRIFRRSELEAREREAKQLDSRGSELATKEKRIDKDATTAKADFEQVKKTLVEELTNETNQLETVLKEASINDALELRADACKRLSHEATQLLARTVTSKPPGQTA